MNSQGELRECERESIAPTFTQETEWFLPRRLPMNIGIWRGVRSCKHPLFWLKQKSQKRGCNSLLTEDLILVQDERWRRG